MKHYRIMGILATLVGLSPGPGASADVVGFVNNPSRNSADFAAAIGALGLVVEPCVNFTDHPEGPLIPEFYSSRGVHLASAADHTNRVARGTGSGSGSSGQGEGQMREPETYLEVGTTGTPGYVEIAFDSPRHGVGLMTGDMYIGSVPVNLTVFDAAGGVLGSFPRVEGIDFQYDELYFMGAVDSEGRIARARLDFVSAAGDTIYIPEFRYSVSEVDECRPDCNGDCTLNINDFICFQTEWRRKTAYGDFNGDGRWNVNDFIAFQAAWRKGCP